MRGAQTRCQKPERPPRSLEIRDGGPSLAHEVDEGRVEGIGSADTITKDQPVLLSLLPLGIALGIRPAHLGHGLLERTRRGAGLGLGWQLGKKPPLDDRENLIPLHWLAALVLPGGQMIDRLKQVDIFEGFPLARLERESQSGVVRVADGDSQSLNEGQGLVPESRLLDLDTTRADQIVENLVEQDQVRTFSQQLKDLIAAWCDPRFILCPE